MCFFLFCDVEEEEIPEMPVELYMLDKLKARVQLARQIDTAQHKTRKENHEKNWLKETAEAMEIELDSGLERYVLVFLLSHRDELAESHCVSWCIVRTMKLRVHRQSRSARRRRRRWQG